MPAALRGDNLSIIEKGRQGEQAVLLSGKSPPFSFTKELNFMGNCVKDNPLRSRRDVERAAVQLIEPLLPLLSPNKARLHLGDTGAVYR